MSDEYIKFISHKARLDTPTGLNDIPSLGPHLFDFQRDIVRWALRRGRAAIFAGCGMGKTPMQLEWARHIPGRVLILAPLAVAQQTVREGLKFGIEVKYAREDTGERIIVSNYEMMDQFNPSDFTGIVLDESSILKAYDGKTRERIIRTFGGVQYRLACTATPAPNDYMELGNHAEFLGVMTREEMLSMYFVHDGGDTSQWRIKRHGQDAFWRWISSWAVMIQMPSDLGYDDGRFVLPPIEYHQHEVKVDRAESSEYLFVMEAQTLQDRISARRTSVLERVEECARVVSREPGEPWIVWCGLNSESDALSRSIPGAVEVRGSEDQSVKERKLLDFTEGRIRVLVTKPTIAGFGMNWQHCARVAFVGLSDSWEQYYQAIRRCWRFGQERPVDVHIITAETEGAVVKNIQRKEEDAAAMSREMVAHMADLNSSAIKGTCRDVSDYREDTAEGKGWTMHLGDCVDVVSRMASESVHYSIFSPPFASLYTYSNSDRDMGNCSDYEEFGDHFMFLLVELYRVLMPGRLLSFHCMNLPTSKVHDGYIGIRDFRGDLIRMFLDAGFIFHSEVVIWKDPVTAMQRTKAIGLLHKQLKKDSCMSRMGIPDYLVTMRKPGENPERVSHTNEEYPVTLWQRVASPVWSDINPNDTLQFRSARDNDDERHICPLQLEVIRRAMRLWSNPGDLVLSPFAGIGSEGVVSIEEGRRFVGVELKQSYWSAARKNLEFASMPPQQDLFSMVQP